MTYLEFCAAAIALLADKPKNTGLMCGAGALFADEEKCLMGVAQNNDGTLEPISNAFETDWTAWDNGAWDGITAAEVQECLDNPVFVAIEQGEPVDAITAHYSDRNASGLAALAT